MLIIGGIGSVPGAVIGTIFVMVVPEVLRFLESYYWLVFSIIALLFVIFLPYGLVSLFGNNGKLSLLFQKKVARITLKGGRNR
jgi:branched-chain amino acid transport system permease protein